MHNFLHTCIFLIMIAFAVMPGVGCTPEAGDVEDLAQNNADALNKQGMRHYSKGGYLMALRLFQRAASSDADNPEYANNAGMCLLRMRQPGESLQYFKKAIAQKKGHAMYYYNIGLAYRDLNYTDLAIASFQEATQMQADYFDALAELGILKLKIGQTKNAIEHLKAATNLRKSYELESHLGVALMQAGDLAAAAKHLQQSITLKPSYQLAHYNLGVVQQKLKNYAGAEASYQKALQLNPEYFLVYYNLAIVQRQQSRQAAARLSLQKFLSKAPRQMYRQRSDAQRLLQQWK